MSEQSHEAETAGLGHNQGPSLDPFTTISNGIKDLYEEAHHWLDGEPVTTEKQAENLALLGDQIKKAAKEAETMRKAEKKPHDDAAKAVQAKFKPLLEKATQAQQVLEQALQPYMVAKKQEQEAVAQAAREEAERKRAEAMEAMRESAGNLAEREAAEAKVQEAKQAETEARQAEKARPTVKGEGRARTVVTRYIAVVSDMRLAARALWDMYPDQFRLFVSDLAQRAVSDKAKDIPGVDIHTEERVRS